MITATMLHDNLQTPHMRNAYGFALAMHAAMFVWNPTLLSSHMVDHAPALMQVEFRDKMPELPKPAPVVVPKVVKKEPPVKKARKSGISLADRRSAPVAIRPVKRPPMKVASKPPLPQSRPSRVKMPKFIPHASDEDALVSAAHSGKVALTKALRPATNPMHTAPVLVSKSKGIRASDVHFELTDRGGISSAGSHVVNIPIGADSGETAVVASAPALHDAPKGLRHTSGYHYEAPLGDGVGVLAGKSRSGYVGAIQVGEPSEEEVIAAAGTARGTAVGRGVEIGGPVGDRKILRRHLPEYPAWAEEKGISAIVKIFFTVKPDGSIRQSLRVVRSSGYSELDSLAKDALLAWRFSPTAASSSADEAWGVITFRFTLA